MENIDHMIKSVKSKSKTIDESIEIINRIKHGGIAYISTPGHNSIMVNGEKLKRLTSLLDKFMEEDAEALAPDLATLKNLSDLVGVKN